MSSIKIYKTSLTSRESKVGISDYAETTLWVTGYTDEMPGHHHQQHGEGSARKLPTMATSELQSFLGSVSEWGRECELVGVFSVHIKYIGHSYFSCLGKHDMAELHTYTCTHTHTHTHTHNRCQLFLNRHNKISSIVACTNYFSVSNQFSDYNASCILLELHWSFRSV